MMKFIIFRNPQQWILALLFLLTILASKSLSAPPDQPINPWTLRNMMGRGVNMKAALGGKHNWWIKYNPKHGEAIQKAGFNSVRVWFFWAGLNSGSPDYTLSPAALEDMENIINDLLNRNLVVVLVPMELGNYGEKNLTTNPSAHKAKYLSIWKQLADRFRNHSHRLVFDLFNEPHGELGKKELNDWHESVVPIIRKTNPTRVLIFNGDDWGTASTLKNIIIPPEAGQYVMGDFHYYWPMGFTHHGNQAWTGTVEQKNRVRVEFNKAVAWSKKYDIPVVCTEWGSNNIRSLSEREAYHLFIRDELLVRGFSYQQYAFSDGQFKMYDGFKHQWVYPTLRDIAVAGDASWEVSASKPDHRPKWKQYLANLRFDFLFKYLFF
ncbi:glycoside hydrolase family 5 [Gloeothece citriformis PCC 7424]|uniref:Glycoside hydrolase family 5 n=1 Tax=Gloeothece citriformis (strain PCC 7424) TaxID=65393 RepID=B7KAI4_GLOC7|nr:glycoside hydrolase family 5 protein [Gloeothece citriformis]ACK72958.1 glycoside hydrolase family 5 [Gloeothece citriformis PCC 7424]